MKNKTTVIYHSADFDGLFCREIARKFLGTEGVEFIGWDFKDPPLTVPAEGTVCVMDLPVDRVFGFNYVDGLPPEEWRQRLEATNCRIIWIDHHASSIASHPPSLPGYRIDGVAACRLAWWWFSCYAHDATTGGKLLFGKQAFVDREIPGEPLAVRLAGEYDIWDKRDERAETFQFGLRAEPLGEFTWRMMLSNEVPAALKGTGKMERTESEIIVPALLEKGALLQRYQAGRDEIVAKRGFTAKFEGLTFLMVNTAYCNSLTFHSALRPEHDALMGFYYDGKLWNVSMYHAKGKEHHDLSAIAVKYKGGGHRGACGFRSAAMPIDVDGYQLPATTDAVVWAKEFVRIVKEVNPAIATDEMTMTTWMASAIMAGHDEAMRRKTTRNPGEVTRVNLNDGVRFKLTKKGIDYIAELNRSHPVYSRVPLKYKPDTDGWIETQLWEFASIFGSTFGMGFDQTVETVIGLRSCQA